MLYKLDRPRLPQNLRQTTQDASRYGCARSRARIMFLATYFTISSAAISNLARHNTAHAESIILHVRFLPQIFSYISSADQRNLRQKCEGLLDLFLYFASPPRKSLTQRKCIEGKSQMEGKPETTGKTLASRISRAIPKIHERFTSPCHETRANPQRHAEETLTIARGRRAQA